MNVRKKLLVASVMIGMMIPACTSKNSFNVTWNVDGVLNIETYAFGDMPSYKGGTPTKASDETYTYTFAGWDKEIQTVAESITYVAMFDREYIDYDITWVVEGVSTVEQYHYGEMPTFKGTPEKAPFEDIVYTFKGWDKTVTAVSGNETYTAVFEGSILEFNITWVVDGVETKEVYRQNQMPTFKGSTDKAATAQYTYTYIGWDKEVVPAVADAVYTAQYDRTVNKYNVTWVVNGTPSIESYEYGATPSFKGSTDKAPTAQYTYTFNGWDKAITEVTEDVIYTAQYTETINKYTVTWIYGDGQTSVNRINYGVMPTAPTEVEKLGNVQYTYSFKGWDKQIKEVTEDVTYTAQYDTIVNKYDVTFLDASGNLIETVKTEYGKQPVAPTAPTIEGLTFVGWVNGSKTFASKDLPVVIADTTYKAFYQVCVKLEMVDTSGNSIDNQNVYVTPGEAYNITAPAVEGKVASNDYFRGIAKENLTKQLVYSELSAWQGTTDKSDELSSEGDTYLINNAGDFYLFATQVNGGNTFEGKTIKMMVSVQINKDFPKIGATDTAFAGTFDGNGCTIRGIEISSTGTRTALFFGLAASGTIKNLSTYGKASVAQYGAVVVGRTLGKLENITNYANVTHATANGGAGITGAIVSGGNITNCVNYGNVKSSITTNNKTAGIVAMSETAAGAITGCINFGDVTGGQLVGGVVGEIANNSSAKSGTYNCVNFGNITSTSATTSGVVGGVVGQVSNEANKVNVVGCSNYGNVMNNKTNNTGVGGVVGAFNSKVATTKVENCYNAGQVHGNNRTGGVVGHAYSQVINCVNDGEVIGGISGSAVGDRAKWIGGVVGVAYTGSTIDDCVNNGKVSTTGIFVGGVLGCVSGSTTLNRCTNNGEVVTTGNGAGGIAGGTLSKTASIVVNNSTNNGTVTALNKVGGIIGCAWSASSAANTCTNTGTITATTTSATATIYCDDIIGQNADQYAAEQAA